MAKRTSEQVPEVVEALKNILGLKGESGKLFGPDYESDLQHLRIDWNNILEAVDPNGKTNYTFGILDDQNDPHNFHNLIISKTGEGAFDMPYLLTYHMADEFVPEYEASGSMQNFVGTISKKTLARASLFNEQGYLTPKLSGDDTDDSDSDNNNDPNDEGPDVRCEEDIIITNGGGNGGSSSGGSTLPGVTCEYVLVTETYSWKVCDGSGCEYHSEVISVTLQIECHENAERGISGNDDCPKPGGEIGILPPPRHHSIDYSALKPCMQDMVDDVLKLAAGSTDLASLFDIPTSGNFDWELRHGKPDGVNKMASTIPDLSTGKITTTFDTNKFLDATDLFVVKTILHEAIHAYMESLMRNDRSLFNETFPNLLSDFNLQLYGNDTEAYQHEEMARSFIPEIRDALVQYASMKNINVDSAYLEKLAWGGLEGTKTFKDLGQTEGDDIKDVISIEHTRMDMRENRKPQKGNSAGC